MLQGWPKMLFIGLSCYFEANFEIIPVCYFLVYFLSVTFSMLFQLYKQGSSYFLKIMLLVYIVAPILSIFSPVQSCKSGVCMYGCCPMRRRKSYFLYKVVQVVCMYGDCPMRRRSNSLSLPLLEVGAASGKVRCK